LKKSFDIDRFKVNLDGRIGHGAGAGVKVESNILMVS
jgi:hypothetical protein